MRRHPFRKSMSHHLGAWMLLAAASTASIRAGTDSWTPFGPYQGNIETVAASSRGDLYAVTGFSQGAIADIWQLPAGSSVWRWRSNGLGRPVVRMLAVHPTRPDLLWAIAGGFSEILYRSTDGGASWQQVAPGRGDLTITGLWVMPTRSSPHVLFAATGGTDTRGLLRSGDGGVSWREVRGAIGPVAPAPDQRNLVYAAADGGGFVLRSDDGGVTFRATRPPGVAPGEALRALHVTRGRHPIAFASFASAGLYRSLDGGRWERVADSRVGTAAIASEPRDARIVYATGGGGIYVSTRSGRAGTFRLDSFTVLASVPPPTALVAAPSGPLALTAGDLWAGGGRGPLAETGMIAFGAAELRFAPTDPSSLALRTFGGCSPPCIRTFFSRDGGATFRRHGAALSPRWFLDVYDLAFDPATATRRLESWSAGVRLIESGISQPPSLFVADTVEITSGGGLLAGNADGVLAKRGAGHPWSVTLPVATGGSSRVIDLRADLGAPERVVAVALEASATDPVTYDFVAFRSTDAGATWSPLLGGARGVVDVEAVPGRPATLYALVLIGGGTGGSELRRSDDDGRTSVLVHTFAAADQVRDVAVDPSLPTDLYAGSAAGLLRSRDGGSTWESTPGDLSAWAPYRQRILHVWMHPIERGHVFAAPADGGLFENRLSD